MPTIATLGAFAVASIALLVIPGPAVVFIVNRSVASGRRVGLASAVGLQLGSLVHVLAATVGLSAVIAASAVAFSAVKWLGAAYLVGTGVATLARRAGRAAGATGDVGAARAFRQGFVVNALNPKVALFFLSFLPQFLDADRAAAPQALALGAVFVTLGLANDGGYALLAGSLREVLLRGRALPFVQRWVSGSVFVALGVVAARAKVA
ncbi:MAG: LysE family translocator [Acidimicrobiia bacterium]